MARKASTPTPATGTDVATVTPALTGTVLDATGSANLDAARVDAAWADYLALPADTTATDRRARLTAILAAGDLTAGDRVADLMTSLDGATRAWGRTARAAHAAVTVAGMSVPDVARALGATADVLARESNGKRVTRMVRGWTLVLADNATRKAPDALRPYIVVGNVITAGDLALAVTALASGKGIAAIGREVSADKSPTPKATSTPRVSAGDAPTGDAADAGADTPASAILAPTAGDLAGTLAGMTDATLAAVAVAVARACKARKWADAGAAVALAGVLTGAARHLDADLASALDALADAADASVSA
jgi:hypothetical protein